MLEHFRRSLTESIIEALALVGQSRTSIAFAVVVLLAGLAVGVWRSRGAPTKRKRLVKGFFEGAAVPVVLWIAVLCFYVVVVTPYSEWKTEHSRADLEHTRAELAQKGLGEAVDAAKNAADTTCKTALDKKDREITDLKRQDGTKTALPPINVYAGGGPLPTYSLGEAQAGYFFDTEAREWFAPSHGGVSLDWADLRGIDVTVELTVVAMSPNRWAQAGVYCLEEQRMVVEGERTDSTDGVQQRHKLPRGSGRLTYQLRVRTGGGSSAGVSAGGTLVLVRQ